MALVTPRVNQVPIDRSSDKPKYATEATKRFYRDEETQERIKHTKTFNLAICYTE